MGAFLTPLEHQVLRYATVGRRSSIPTAAPGANQDGDRLRPAMVLHRHPVAGVNAWLEKARRRSSWALPRGV
jgi:hypothetical protein